MNPFILQEPFVLSFSGGRTSGVLLRRTLDAYDGKLPQFARVIYTNTGKERPETLDFVERVSLEWDVPIVWLEFRWEPGRYYFVEVNYATASRNGEPFEMLIEAAKCLPDQSKRVCTKELKIKTMHRYVTQTLGWRGGYLNAVGLRYDEPTRVARVRCETPPIEETLFGDEIVECYNACPLFDAHVTLPDVYEFWRQQPFDLQLKEGEGNCDLCFLKGRKLLVELMRRKPESAAWWIAQEQRVPLSGGGGVWRRFIPDRHTMRTCFRWLRLRPKKSTCQTLASPLTAIVPTNPIPTLAPTSPQGVPRCRPRRRMRR